MGVLLTWAASVVAQEPRGCTASTYVAAFAPVTDQETSPQLWLVPVEGGGVGNPYVLHLPDANVRDVRCSGAGVLLKGEKTIRLVPVEHGKGDRVVSASLDDWHKAKRSQGRAFDLHRDRLVPLASAPSWWLVVARSDDSIDGVPTTFVAVFLKKWGGHGLGTQLLFTNTYMTVTVE